MNLVRRAQLERRMSISDLDRMMDMDSLGQPTYTGKLVSPQTALRVSTVWRCIDGISGDMASLPLLTFRYTGDYTSGTFAKTPAADHYLWPLLQFESNPAMTSWRFKKIMQTWLLLWGNAYAEIETNGRGQVTALWPWRPDRVKIFRAYMPDGPLVYQYTMADGRTKIVKPAVDVLHLRGLGIDGITGLSPIDVHKQTIGFSMGLTEHGARYFGNGANAGAVLQYPGKLSDKARENLKNSWNQEHRGLENAYRLAILEEGMTYKETANASMVDADYLDTMKFTVLDIARIFNFPAHRAGDLSQSTNNNIETQGLEYVLYCIGPWAANWESEIEFSLLAERDRANICTRYRFRNLIRGDMAAQAAFYGAMIDKGVMTQNDVREEIDLNPFPSKLADEPWKQIATAPAGDSYTPPKSQMQPAPAGIEAALKPNGKPKGVTTQ